MADRPDELYLIDGNSLVYRAFFALPESIATSTGFPTNAIFGFASMLVKILTEHGTKPTIVAWDAGASGRKEVYSEYKAGRLTRPDLLKEQWPHFEPLVEAFGYKNIRLAGFEADDVIATLAERAREQGIPTVIVTGDRDAFQLIDPGGLVSVMATSRGITDTKLYDYGAVVDRYGIAPELIPDFYGLKGDTSDNIPGVPGIGDKTASQLLQRFGDLEAVLGSIDEITGAKRKQNLAEHAENARLSKVLATMRRDLPIDLDVVQAASQAPDRSKLREVFREFELRDPLRRLEEFLGSDEAAPAPVASTQVTARVRPGTLADVAAFGGSAAELVLAARAPEIPEGELLALETTWRFAVAAGREVLTGPMDDPAQLVAAAGERPVVAYDAKSFGSVPPNLAHDALLGAYLLEPARRGYPLRELLEERGLGAPDVEDELAREALLVGELSTWQREQIVARDLVRVMQEIELPLVPVLRRMELEGVRLNTDRLREITARVREEIRTLELEIWDLAGTEFVIGSPQQLGEILFTKLELSRKRRGKTGFSTDARVLQAIRDEHPIIPMIERWRELNQLDKTYFSVLPQLADERSRI
ncbi:MAG: DNA polymerase I, partial [Actinobacteria bacterium]|nr:DNA polymerase I [Actinomycetota bacterium]